LTILHIRTVKQGQLQTIIIIEFNYMYANDINSILKSQ